MDIHRNNQKGPRDHEKLTILITGKTMLNTFSNSTESMTRRHEREQHMDVILNQVSHSNSNLEIMDSLDDSLDFFLNDPNLIGSLNLAKLYEQEEIAELQELENRNKCFKRNFLGYMIPTVCMKSPMRLIGVVLLVIIAIISVISTGPTSKLQSLNGNMKMVGDWIIAQNVSSPTQLEDPESPQHKALKWIVANTFSEVISLERYALACFYFSTDSPHEMENWMTNTSVCSWFGVKCNPQGKFIEALNLTNKEISGVIATEISYLDGLKVLDLRNNHLSGEIPNNFGRLSQLKELFLGFNYLSGTIPELATNLQVLYLHTNYFSGTIPETLCKIQALKGIALHENELTGEIPSCIGNLIHLYVLYLDSNMLTGTIPATFRDLHVGK